MIIIHFKTLDEVRVNFVEDTGRTVTLGVFNTVQPAESFASQYRAFMASFGYPYFILNLCLDI